MAGVALAGCLLFALAALKDGTFDWPRYTSIVGVIVLVCAGSWGLSALTAIVYRSKRPRRSGVPGSRLKAGPVARSPSSGSSLRAETLAFGAATFGAFLVGLGCVAVFHTFSGPSDAAHELTIVRAGKVTHGRSSEATRGAAITSQSVAPTAYSLCQSSAQPSCVIDGDTIRHDGVKIRLADIDTPEISEPKCSAEAALGHRAKERLLQLLNEAPFEMVHPGGRDEDPYGRKLRLLVRDGRSLGLVLVDEGLAKRWTGRRESWCA